MDFREVALSLLGVFLVRPSLGAAPDPTELVAGATKRLEEVISTIRKTGNFSAVSADLEASRAELESAHQAFLRSHRDAEASYALVRAGDCLRILNRWAEAKERYQTAIEEARRGHNVEFEAKAWLGLAKAESLGFQSHQASSDDIQQVLRLSSNSEKLRAIYVDAMGEQAALQLREGQFEQAMATINEAIAGVEQLGDPERLWPILHIRTSIQQSMYDESRTRYFNMPYATAAEWRKCEALANELRQTLQQERLDLGRVIAINKELGHDYFAKSIASELGPLAQIERSLEELVTLKKGAHEAAWKTDPPEDKPLQPLMATREGKPIETNLLGPAVPIINPTQQNELSDTIEATRKRLREGPEVQSTLWRKRFTEGTLFEAENKLDQALACYREGARLIQNERKTISGEASRSSFTAEKLDLYDRLILNLLARGEYEEALEWMEQSRARATLDMLTSVELHLPSAKERSLYADLMAARAASEKAVRTGRRTEEARANYEALLQRIRQETPHLYELAASQPVTLAALQRVLADTPSDLVYYILHQGRIVLWHIGPKQIDVKAYFAPASELQRLGRNMITSLSRRGDFNREAAEYLHFYLAQPALEVMETKQLIIVPPPELQGVPFQAFLRREPGQFFGEEMALSYASSASLIAKLQPAAKISDANVLAMIGPEVKSGEVDAAAIAALFPRHTILRESSANFAELQKQAAGRTAVHIAAHGQYNAEEPMLSHFQLSPGSDHDGNVTAAQVFSLPLKGVSVFTLAACSTAQAKVESNNEVYGFVRSLLYAGAQSAILPLWDVSDDAAAFWFRAFYSEARTHSLPEAARLAIVAARKHPVFGSEPRYWAGYMLVGH